jgi:hypothetical protein
VTYFDEENSPPAGGVRLLIDGGRMDETMVLDTEADPLLRDGNMTNGEAYIFSTNLSIGAHGFRFNASDGDAYVQIGPYSGPIVSLDPILIPMIDSPRDGDLYHEDENISFSGHFESNVDIDDTVYVWYSNISGHLGSGPGILVRLEIGNHTITLNVSSQERLISSEATVNITVMENVSSQERLISSEATVNITVMEREPEPEVMIILDKHPRADSMITEGDNATFMVVLNDDHPLMIAGTDLTFVWRLDGNYVEVQESYLDYRPGYLASGGHLLEMTLYAGNIVETVSWNITVLDVPAPILITGELPDDLGQFRKREVLSVSLPLMDPAGRELTTTWSVDGSQIPGGSTSLDLELRGGIWAHEGDHVLRAEVSNPDGSILVLNITYHLVEEEVDDDDVEHDDDPDDDEEDDDEDKDDERPNIFKDDPVGAIIIAGGCLAVIIGVVYALFVLVKPEGSIRPRKRDVWEE